MFGIGSLLGKIATGLPVGQALGTMPSAMVDALGKTMGKAGPLIKDRAGIGQSKGPFGAFGGADIAKAGGLGARDTHKAAYMAALAHAMDKAHGSHAFNMETHINDLWVRLSNLRTSSGQLDGLHEAIAGSTQHSAELKQLLSGLGGVIQQMMPKIK
ncbi:hypothetical protein [Sphingomonas sp.]|jgi:hypothetical protein|uniref:hypothetical protein n=1 Tax=Sphingomonas sp. TaxID=28214 RepID=UPI002D808001|nr:hypothetical protein [Sphingomonas sp.]HEU0044254.1 hypothetical protein [Sphingomonas sp.]